MISGRDKLLLDSISPFYYNTKMMHNLIPIFNGTSCISLRILDWFVTNYTKENNIIIKKDCLYNNIYLNYKAQLKAYSKKQFDPFCRRERIVFFYDKTNFITSTVGQLNFFKWALENNIIEYIEKNFKIIESNMNITNTKTKISKMSLSASKKINKNNIEVTIKFD